MCNNTHCTSSRIVSVVAKCSDMSVLQLGDKEHEGYVPDDCGIGGGDYIKFNYCLTCGQIQGEFPLDKPSFCQKDDEEE